MSPSVVPGARATSPDTSTLRRGCLHCRERSTRTDRTGTRLQSESRRSPRRSLSCREPRILRTQRSRRDPFWRIAVFCNAINLTDVRQTDTTIRWFGPRPDPAAIPSPMYGRRLWSHFQRRHPRRAPDPPTRTPLPRVGMPRSVRLEILDNCGHTGVAIRQPVLRHQRSAQRELERGHAQGRTGRRSSADCHGNRRRGSSSRC